MKIEEFPARIDAMASGFENKPLDSVMEKCHSHLVEGIASCFDGKQGPDGEIWPARMEIKKTHPLMNESGALRAAATGGAGHIKEVYPRAVVTGVRKADTGSLAGAAIHQYGGTIYPRNKPFLVFQLNGELVFAKKVTIPARPYLGATLDAIDACREDISEAFLNGVFG